MQIVKKGVTEWVLTAVGVVTAILAFIGLALDFFVVSVGGDSLGGNLGDWTQMLDETSSDLGGWPASRVWLIITLVMVALLVVASITKIFIENKILNIATLSASALTLVVALIFVGTFGHGCGAVSVTVDVCAGVGVYFVTFGAIITSAMTAITSLKLK